MTQTTRGFLIGGTGPWAPDWFDPLRIGHRMATRYYQPILSALDLELIDLPLGGWQHPEACFQGVSRAINRKRGDSSERIVLVGHSQGVLRAVEYSIAHPDAVEMVIGLMGPLDGSYLSSFQVPMSGGRGMAPGARRLVSLTERQMAMVRQRELTGQHLPDVHLLSAHHDLLVECRSALAPDCEYPRISRYCITAGDHDHGPGVEKIDVYPWQDNHLLGVRAKPVIRQLQIISGRQPRRRLQVVRSAA
ncbi:MAG TPA: hypothetical protein VLF41_03880 [Candidatus Nanoarchaeia archaeon]|nr:hypothetical protein [Candidatus Nanoarchaeia archaeon]